MKKESSERKLKRQTLRSKGLTFADRVREAIRLHKPVQGINWQQSKPKVQGL